MNWLTGKLGNRHILEIGKQTAFLVIELDSKQAAAALLSKEQIKTLSNSNSGLLESVRELGTPVSYRLLGDSSLFAELIEILGNQFGTSGRHVQLMEPKTELMFLPLENRIRVRKIEASTPVAAKKTRVLVVDDSETIRKLLSQVFSQDPEIECVGTIDNPLQVLSAIERLKPDVVTLDIHMPQMDGVTLLKKIVRERPLPAVMISALSREEGGAVLDALEAGAVDYIQKPSLKELPVLGPIICEKIKNARTARVIRPATEPRLRATLQNGEIDTSFLVAIGSSTGGTEALKQLLTALPDQIPPILIVQHIPPIFSKAFAERMNQLCPFTVKEGEQDDLVQPGVVIIAPGGRQMKVRKVGGELRIGIDDTDPVNRHKPSVDVLFESIAKIDRQKIISGILTGMGTDGAKGLLSLRKHGAKTFAQDEASSVVYGMPREAARVGAAEKILPLNEVAPLIVDWCTADFRKAGGR